MIYEDFYFNYAERKQRTFILVSKSFLAMVLTISDMLCDAPNQLFTLLAHIKNGIN